jgi:hypothetical protein
MWPWRLKAVAPTEASDLEAIPKMHLTADGPPQADCTPPKSAHNLPRLLRFFIGVRLAPTCDLLFLRWLLVSVGFAGAADGSNGS